MPSLPLSADFTNSAVTEAEFKTAITNQREFLAGLLGTTGNQIDALKAMGVPLNDTVAKTGAYTVIAADRGVTLLCNGTFTVSLTAAATLGDGFTFAVVNTGTGVITIDPNSTEQIDGGTTKTISAGSSAIVTTNGTAFYSVGGGGGGALIGYQIFTSTGTYTKGTNNPSFVIVEVQGGGGNGSAGNATWSGTGGGSGAYAKKKITATSLASSVTVTVGAATGTSSFGTFVSCTGGATGASNSGTALGGSGGTATGGDININGNGGGNWAPNAVPSGANSILGIGGRGANSVQVAGLAGTGYGSGGGGGNTNFAGGSGAPGIVIVWEYA